MYSTREVRVYIRYIPAAFVYVPFANPAHVQIVSRINYLLAKISLSLFLSCILYV